MATNLVIVESPAKAKTIKKYLGKDFEVMASYGHVRDLPAKQGAIKPEEDFKNDDFTPNYVALEKSSKHMGEIVKAMKKADALYLATDPDREGEAISWHVQAILKEKKVLKDKPVHRVVFHQITKTAVQDAIANPREISMPLVHAQQARRALDYLVGFNLSPLLWKKIRRGLSAGRVQSPALRLIVEREIEIEKFVTQEYWTIGAELNHEKQDFGARLTHFKDEKLEQFSITDEKNATQITDTLATLAKGKLKVFKVEKKERKRNPTAPFITSTLQQEAARKLGFTAQRTMRTAQNLYEGIDLGEGNVGLITYMRTDSVTLATEAVAEIRNVIEELYGKDCVPSEPNVYKSKVKNAQEAHEAIRPTSAALQPSKVKKHLTPEQFKLYDLIWKRTIACQMIPAVIDTVSADMKCGAGNMFRANGSTVKVPGFLQVYQEDNDDVAPTDERMLPPLKEGDEVKLIEIKPTQHFTEPPPRYSEASLIKSLEERGIGRPSTYASIISTLQNREYVTLDQKRFYPTDVGRIVNKFLTEYFNQYVSYDFTALLEDQLDEVSRGEKEWVPMMRDFWTPFKKQIDEIEVSVQRSDVTQEKIDENCPKCQKPLSIRLGRRGRFIGCSGYPDCDYTRSLEGDNAEEANETLEGRKCPKCEHDLVYKFGRYGKFIGCSNYPECKFIESLNKPKETGVQCPDCKQGQILERKSRYGKIFFSCERYPDCKYAIWYKPLTEACPKCSWPITMVKVTKRRGVEKACPQKECDFAEPYGEEEQPQ